MQSAQVKTNHSLKAPAQNVQRKRRVVQMDGNVAHVKSGFAKQKVRQPKKQTKAQAKAQAKVREKAQAKRSRAGLGMTMFVLLTAFCALVLLVSRYAVVCSIGAQNNALEQQIMTIEGKIDNLAVELELKDDLEFVHDTAQTELGMKYPDQSQKISISLDG